MPGTSQGRATGTPGSTCSDPLGRERLQVESGRILGGVGDLQHCRTVAVDQEGLVTLTLGDLGHAVHGKQVTCDAGRLCLAEGGWRGGQDPVDHEEGCAEVRLSRTSRQRAAKSGS